MKSLWNPWKQPRLTLLGMEACEYPALQIWAHEVMDGAGNRVCGAHTGYAPIGTPKGISDMLDTMEGHKNLFPDERAAIEMVVNLGETYGFGNLIAWLKTAWAIRLRDHHKIQTSVALASVDASPYPLPPCEVCLHESTRTDQGAIVCNICGETIAP